MIKYLTLEQSSKYLFCPADQASLKILKNSLQCKKCKRKFNLSGKIIEFVKDEELNSRTKKERKGNEFKLDKKTIEAYAGKDKWSTYHQYIADKKFSILLKKMSKIKTEGLVSLGSGTGYEIKKILQKRKINLIFASDLALTATMIVPYSLKGFPVKLCLFTSDMNKSPVVPNDKMPVLVFEAMHHTGDIHKTMKLLMERGYRDILFVEPTKNFIISFLAKFGLAERVEYSGSKPDLLSIKKLKEIAKAEGYDLDIDIIWEFPEDFYKKIFGDNPTIEKYFLKFADFLSWLGNFNKIGYMSIGHLSRK